MRLYAGLAVLLGVSAPLGALGQLSMSRLNPAAGAVCASDTQTFRYTATPRFQVITYSLGINVNTFPLVPVTGASVNISSQLDGAAAAEFISVPIALPAGFDFEYFGQPVTSLRVARDGYITFGSAPGARITNQPLPTDGLPQDLVAGLWTRTSDSPWVSSVTRRIVHEVSGTAPNRRFAITWADIPLQGGGNMNLQISLDETSDSIFVHLGGANNTNPKTTGLESGAAAPNTIGIPLLNAVSANLGIAFNLVVSYAPVTTQTPSRVVIRRDGNPTPIDSFQVTVGTTDRPTILPATPATYNFTSAIRYQTSATSFTEVANTEGNIPITVPTLAQFSGAELQYLPSGQDTICNLPGAPTVVQAVVAGGLAPYSLRWEVARIAGGPLGVVRTRAFAVGDTLQIQPNGSNYGPGRYRVTVQLNDANNCLVGIGQVNDVATTEFSIVDPPIGGTVTAASDSVCADDFTSLTVTGQLGGDIQWQESTSASGPFSDITGATGTSVVPTPLTGPGIRFFRARINRLGSNCSSVFSTVDSIRYFNEPNPGAISVSGGVAQACATGVPLTSQLTFNLTGAQGNLRWLRATSAAGPYSPIAGATATTLTRDYSAFPAGTSEFLRVEAQTPCDTDTTLSPFQVVITSPADGGAIQVSGATTADVCENGAITINATGVDADTIRWVRANNAAFTGPVTTEAVQASPTATPSLTVGPLAPGTYFYKIRALKRGSGCVTDSSNVMTIVSAPLPQAGTGVTLVGGNPFFCTGSVGDQLQLQATGTTSGNLQWQLSRNAGGPFVNLTGGGATTANLTVALDSITITGTAQQRFYRLVASSPGAVCPQAVSSVFSVTLEPEPNAGALPTVSNAQLCDNENGTVTFTGVVGDTVRIQRATNAAFTGATVVDTRTNVNGTVVFNTGVLTPATYFFRTVATNRGVFCGTSTGTAAQIAVTERPTVGATTVTASNLCIGSSFFDTLRVASACATCTVQWQYQDGANWFPVTSAGSPTDNEAFFSGNQVFAFTARTSGVPLTASTQNFRAISFTGCDTIISGTQSINFTEAGIGNITSAVNAQYCVGDVFTVTATTSNGTGSWRSTGGSVTFSSTTTPTTTVTVLPGSANNSVTLFWEVGGAGCPIDVQSRTFFVPATPVADFTSLTTLQQLCEQDPIIISLAAFDSTVFMPTAAGLTSTLGSTFLRLNAFQYRYTPADITTTTSRNDTLRYQLTSTAGCLSPQATRVVTVFPDPVAVITTTQTEFCPGVASVPLSSTGAGGIVSPTPGEWTIVNAGAPGVNGTISAATSPTATYTPAAGDTGNVVLRWTSRSGSACPQVSVQRTFNVQKVPNALLASSPAIVICAPALPGYLQPLPASQPITQTGDLNASAFNADGTPAEVVIWSAFYSDNGLAAAGSFLPSASDTNAVYQAAAADSGRTIILRLEAFNNDNLGNNCTRSTRIRTISVNAVPRGTFTIADDEVCPTDNIVIVEAVNGRTVYRFVNIATGTVLDTIGPNNGPGSSVRLSRSGNTITFRTLATDPSQVRVIQEIRDANANVCGVRVNTDTFRVFFFPTSAQEAVTMQDSVTTCLNEVLTLQASGGPGATFRWNQGALTLVSSPASLDSSTITVRATSTAQADVLVTITNNGCPVVERIRVNTFSGDSLSIRANGVDPSVFNACPNDSVNITSSAPAGFTNPVWTLISGDASPTSFTGAGFRARIGSTAQYQVSYTSPTGCPVSRTEFINVFSAPLPFTLSEDVCVDDSQLVVVATGGGTNLNGCVRSYWFRLPPASVLNPAIVQFAPGGSSVTLGRQFVVGPDSVIFPVSIDQAGNPIGAVVGVDTLRPSEAKSFYDYTYVCFSADGCLTLAGSIYFVQPDPQADFRQRPASDPTFTPVRSVEVAFDDRRVQFVNITPLMRVYLWNFGDGAAPDEGSSELLNTLTFGPGGENTPVIHNFSGPGVYNVTLFVQDSIDCVNLLTADSAVVVREPNFFFPTAFTPNGDDVNDVFQPLPILDTTDVRNLFRQIAIFDRNGNEVFRSANDGTLEVSQVKAFWDGRNSNDQDMPSDVYIYKVDLVLPAGRGQRSFTGTVTLLR